MIPIYTLYREKKKLILILISILYLETPYIKVLHILTSMPCLPEDACQAICRNGKRCSRRGWYETKLCGLHSGKSNVKTIDSDNSSTCVDCKEECPICYGALDDPIKCPNGHLICAKHYINDLLCMWKNRSDNHIKCFVCRQRIDSENFSNQFIHNIPNVYMDASYSKSNPESLLQLKGFLQKSVIDIMKILNFIE